MPSRVARALLVAGAFACAGCWDNPSHLYDSADTTGTGDMDVDSDSDDDADAGTGVGQGHLPPGWEGFGAPCVDDADCTGYPAEERRCITDVMQYVNAPGGYCTACCDEEEIDGCAPGIDCLGANGAYVICIAKCDKNSECRLDEGWECRGVWYLENPKFTGT